MISKRGQMLVNLAVADYQREFPEEYIEVLNIVKQEKDRLKNDFAAVDGTHALKRCMYIVGTKLNDMILQRLSDEDKYVWREKDSQRWFAKTYKQFAITKI